MTRTHRSPAGPRDTILAASAAAFLAFAAPPPARAAYLLGTGDVLEVSVLGVADYRRRVSVNVDGEVSLPLVGEVAATGLTIPDLRKRIAELLEGSRTLRSPDVTIELVEHRPCYVTGDVAKPGAVAYRGGLTARVAIALSGGYDALRFRSENPLLLAPDLRSQYDSLWLDLVRRQARALTLKAEMEGRDKADLSSLDEAPLPQASVWSVADLELRDLKARTADDAKQRKFLEANLTQTQVTIAAYELALQQQTGFLSRQTEAAERLQASYTRGVSPVMRLEEENRSIAGLHSQKLETTGRLALARKERDEAVRAIDRLSDDRKRRLLAESQDAFVEVERLRAAVRALGEKLIYTGAIKAQMREGGKGPELSVHRKVDGKAVSLALGEDDEILPGDVVDVVIRPDNLAAAPIR